VNPFFSCLGTCSFFAGSGENVPVCYRPDKKDCPAKKGIFEVPAPRFVFVGAATGSWCKPADE
jgi:hypothetical protein